MDLQEIRQHVESMDFAKWMPILRAGLPLLEQLYEDSPEWVKKNVITLTGLYFGNIPSWREFSPSIAYLAKIQPVRAVSIPFIMGRPEFLQDYLECDPISPDCKAWFDIVSSRFCPESFRNADPNTKVIWRSEEEYVVYSKIERDYEFYRGKIMDYFVYTDTEDLDIIVSMVHQAHA